MDLQHRYQRIFCGYFTDLSSEHRLKVPIDSARNKNQAQPGIKKGKVAISLYDRIEGKEMAKLNEIKENS